jgi:hypothetical protein
MTVAKKQAKLPFSSLQSKRVSYKAWSKARLLLSCPGKKNLSRCGSLASAAF